MAINWSALDAYESAVRRVQDGYGRPGDFACSYCAADASRWLLHADADATWDYRGRPYSDDPGSYIPVCGWCGSEYFGRPRKAQVRRVSVFDTPGWFVSLFALSSGHTVTAGDAFNAYLDWCEYEHLPYRQRGTRRQFFAEMDARGVTRKRGARGNVFVGIRLRGADEPTWA